MTQLSLGAASAKKDMRSVHLIPQIRITTDKVVKFSVSECRVKDMVVVDGDPSRESQYRELNGCDGYPVCAINNDACEALKTLPDKLRSRGMGKRNTIIALRIDHRMLPDVAEFFRLLAPSIEDGTDLIITIGAGFDLSEFKGRTAVLRTLYDYLYEAGMGPVLLKLHGNGSLEEQWTTQAFGLKSITTYEILHCKLELKLLSRMNGRK